MHVILRQVAPAMQPAAFVSSQKSSMILFVLNRFRLTGDYPAILVMKYERGEGDKRWVCQVRVFVNQWGKGWVLAEKLTFCYFLISGCSFFSLKVRTEILLTVKSEAHFLRNEVYGKMGEYDGGKLSAFIKAQKLN